MLLLINALLAFFAVLAAAQSSNSSNNDTDTHVTCAPGVDQNPAFNWWFNKRKENPCQMLQNLLRKCDADHTIQLMPESPLQRPDICQKTENGNGGGGGEDDPNNFIPCCCNTAAYALRQACWSCQHGQIDPSPGSRRPTFREYLMCPKNVNKADRLYQNVSIPHWAFVPVDPDNTWNLTFTRTLVSQPQFLNTIVMMNLESSANDTRGTNGTDSGGGSGDNNSGSGSEDDSSDGSHGHGSNGGSSSDNTQVLAAILGGALSGLALVVVLLLLVLYIRRRRRDARRLALEEWAGQRDWPSGSPMPEMSTEKVTSPPASLLRGRQGREPLIPRAQATYDPEAPMFDEPTRHLKLSDPRVSESFQWADARTPVRPYGRRTAMNSVATNFSL